MAAPDRKERVLAIDLGTGGPKVALCSMRGDVIAHEFESTPVILTGDGGAEQDPDGWWQAIVRATRRLMERPIASPDDVAAVCCTAQWAGTVAVDGSGRPLMNALTWLDSRGGPLSGQLVGSRLAVAGYDPRKLYRWIRLTGGAPGRSGKDPVGHILWIRANRPDVYRETHMFLEPKDYVNLRLTGSFAASFDSIAMHWVTDNRDMEHIRYDEKLLAQTGLERRLLPDLLAPTDVLGALDPGAADELGLPASAKVVMGTPDLQSAALGSGGAADFDAHLYVGTSAWISCHVPFKKTDVLRNIASLPSALPGRYIVADEQQTAGECLDVLRDSFLFPDDELGTSGEPEDSFARLEEMIERVPPGANGVVFTPWLNGERTPVDDDSIRGGFFNLSLATTRADLVRSVYEGVALNSRWLLATVERFVGRKFDALRFVGGGARSAAWSQILADVLDRPIRQVGDPMLANSRGAALLAGLALGEIGVEDMGAAVEIKRTFHPDEAKRELYDGRFREFLTIYKKTKGICRRLNG